MNKISLSDNYYGDLGLFLYLTPIISAFAAAFVLFVSRERTFAQKYLAIFFVVLGFGMGFSFVYDRYLATNHNEILRSVNFIASVAGSVTVLFYFTALMRPMLLTGKFIGMLGGGWFVYSALICSLELLPVDFVRVVGWKSIMEIISSPAMILRVITNLCIICFDLWLVFFILRMYRRHRRFINENYSYTERINLRWINISIVLFLLIAISDILWMLNSSVEVKIWFNIIVFISIWIIFLLGFRQGKIPLIETEKRHAGKEESFLPESAAVVEPGNKSEEMKAALMDYFHSKKPFLNPELSLTDVSCALNVSQFYLSRLINKEYGMNFYSLVNNYRVDNVISLIELNKGAVTGDMLLAASGFKTRSVFYKRFKDRTGYSPQEYAEKQVGAKMSV